jgi:hypothetical protein
MKQAIVIDLKRLKELMIEYCRERDPRGEVNEREWTLSAFLHWLEKRLEKKTHNATPPSKRTLP